MMNSKEMAKRIAEKIQDPSLWMLELRRLAEELKLDVTRCIPCGAESLQIACFLLLEEARKQGRSNEMIISTLG